MARRPGPPPSGRLPEALGHQLPVSAASRHAQTMAIGIVPLNDEWAWRELQICVRALDAPPAPARPSRAARPRVALTG